MENAEKEAVLISELQELLKEKDKKIKELEELVESVRKEKDSTIEKLLIKIKEFEINSGQISHRQEPQGN